MMKRIKRHFLKRNQIFFSDILGSYRQRYILNLKKHDYKRLFSLGIQPMILKLLIIMIDFLAMKIFH